MKITIGLNHNIGNKKTIIEVVDNPYLPPDVLFVVAGEEDMVIVKEDKNGRMKALYVDVSIRSMLDNWEDIELKGVILKEEKE